MTSAATSIHQLPRPLLASVSSYLSVKAICTAFVRVCSAWRETCRGSARAWPPSAASMSLPTRLPPLAVLNSWRGVGLSQVLKDLAIYEALDDEAACALAQWSGLRSVTSHSDSFPRRVVQRLAEAKHPLQRLQAELQPDDGESWIAAVAQLTSLTEIQIDTGGNQDEDFELNLSSWSSLKSLRSLHVPGLMSAAVCAFADAKLPLTDFTATNRVLASAASCAALFSLPLQRLGLREVDAGISLAGAPASVATLHVYNCERGALDDALRTGAHPLGDSLRALTVWSHHEDDDGSWVPRLSKLYPQLERLELLHMTPCDPRHLASLAQLPRLSELELAWLVKIEDQHCAVLPRIASLTTLRVSRCPLLTARFITEHVGACKRLVSLHVWVPPQKDAERVLQLRGEPLQALARVATLRTTVFTNFSAVGKDSEADALEAEVSKALSQCTRVRCFTLTF